MDIATVAAGVLGVLIPYAKKGAKAFVETVGEVAYEKVKKLLGTLKARWAGDKEAIQALDNLQDKPDRYKAIVEDILKEKLVSDPDLLAELAQHLKGLGPELQVIQRINFGTDVTGVRADKVTSGKVSVTQDIGVAERVVGMDIKDIGD